MHQARFAYTRLSNPQPAAEHSHCRYKSSRSSQPACPARDKSADDLAANDISFVTDVPCKQLADVIEEIDQRDDIFHIPSNKEDEGMGLCAGAFVRNKPVAILTDATFWGGYGDQ